MVAAVPVPAVNPGRLAPAELNRLLLAGAHILVTHSDSVTYPCDVPLPPVISSRSKEDALFQAEMLLEALKEGRSSFAELAQTASDDVFTAKYGGRFGVATAAALPEELADALIGMKEGEVGGPVETLLGYHLVLRLPLPPEERVSGRSLVIGYAGSPENPRDDPGEPPPTRSRAQAKALAEKLSKEAHQAPERFAALVRRHSDGIRAADGGYLGSWSSLHGGKNALLNLAFVSLKVNELSDVVETPFGFQIFQRIAASPTEWLAASAISISFGPNNTPARTKQQAEVLANEVRSSLRAKPERFEELQRLYPQSPPIPPWERANQIVSVDLAVQAVRVGELTAPFVLADSVMILRREPVSAPTTQ
ncbi:MAG: peptidylprolyl isomerase [Archangiaceae bacterium]|nr:peptidylprolyl isomerase [Archangiaceae bacterium]